MREMLMNEEARAWLSQVLSADRSPVLARPDHPERPILRELERSDYLIRLSGEVLVLKKPGDERAEVVRRAYWSIVEAILRNYEPSAIERDSAVRILVGEASPPGVLRIRNGKNSSNFEISLTEELKIAVAAGSVARGSLHEERLADASVLLDEPARILIGLELRFLRENLQMVGLWLKSLVLSRARVEAAYRENPRPVVLRRLAHLAEDAGNPRLAEMLTEVVRTNQRVRIGRGQTGVGRDLILPKEIRGTPTTHRPWLDRLNLQLGSFQEQIAQVVSDYDFPKPSLSASDLIDLARKAKANDVYHSTSIEGYRIRFEDVSVLLVGAPVVGAPVGGSPEDAMAEEDIRSRMAIVGYSNAFDNLMARMEEREGDLPITTHLILDIYADLFQPSVEAGLVEPNAL
jgi:hypothetical protein